MNNIKLFIGAPSFGKTTLLCEYYNKLVQTNRCCIIYNPCDEENDISNEVYEMYPDKIKIPKKITTEYLNKLEVDVILSDETQNRTIEELSNLISYVDDTDKQLFLFGTLFDPHGHIIPSMQYLLEIGIPFELIKRKCSKCGDEAFNTIHTDKKGKIIISPVNNTDDEYDDVIVCRKCYNKYLNKLKFNN